MSRVGKNRATLHDALTMTHCESEMSLALRLKVNVS